MSNYEKLFGFITYFENVKMEEVCHLEGDDKDEDGVIRMPFHVYDKRLEDFIQEVYETDLINHNYLEVLEKHFPKRCNIAYFIDGADFELLTAILTFYIRQERFIDGLWGTAIQQKVFYKALLRLKQLCNQ
jgi:hypothetical protein